MEKISLDSLVTVVADRFVALTRRQKSHTEDSIMGRGKHSAPPSSNDGKWADMGWRGLECRGIPTTQNIIDSSYYGMVKTAVVTFINWYGIEWFIRCLDRIINMEYGVCDCCNVNTKRRDHNLKTWNRMWEVTEFQSILRESIENPRGSKPPKLGIPATIGEGIPVRDLPNRLDGEG